jgi:pyruvate/2-oxoglutarate dehydrogenase complex dihydrolipoamide acyltransferase (E2) component
MELSITAPHDGTVAELRLAPGDRVALREPLLVVRDDLERPEADRPSQDAGLEAPRR